LFPYITVASLCYNSIPVFGHCLIAVGNKWRRIRRGKVPVCLVGHLFRPLLLEVLQKTEVGRCR